MAASQKLIRTGLLGLALLAVGVLFAQEASPPAASGQIASAPAVVTGNSTRQVYRYEDQVVLNVKGSFLADLPFDVTWIGLGSFTTTSMQTVGDKPIMMRVSALLSRRQGNAIWVEGDVVATLLFSLPSSSGTQLVYRDVAVRYNGWIKRGESLVVYEQGGQSITVTVSSVDGK